MKRGSFAAGFLTCLLLAGVTTTAYAAGIMAERSHHRVVVDGKEAQMEAYVINGSNYVKLRDIGKAVGFEVYWDSENGCVQVESGKPYTGEAPAKVEPDKPLSRPEDTSTTIDVNALKQDIIDRTNELLQISMKIIYHDPPALRRDGALIIHIANRVCQIEILVIISCSTVLQNRV